MNALMGDPCVRPFLVALANPEINQVITTDFKVRDLIS